MDPLEHNAPQAAPRPPPLRQAAYLAYGVYAWLVFTACALSTVVAVLLLPTLNLRRTAARRAARLFLTLTRMRLNVSGEANLPATQCVVVANHASYLDGVVMKAVLPPRFGYVVKREMNGVPMAGLMLRRIGTEFVERFDRHKGASDARRVLRNAASGHSLVFFPEGTFHSEPGLHKFHTGAFATAARANCAVVPAVIRGTRQMLPGSRALPRWGTINVELLPAITPAADSPDRAAVELRDRSRAAILVKLDEPDAA